MLIVLRVMICLTFVFGTCGVGCRSVLMGGAWDQGIRTETGD